MDRYEKMDKVAEDLKKDMRHTIDACIIGCLQGNNISDHDCNKCVAYEFRMDIIASQCCSCPKQGSHKDD